MGHKNNIYSLDTFFKIAFDLKKLGKRIGLTHGAFDLFHYSHLDLLQKSAAMCDYLIVGVDSDESINRYKSEQRPVIDEESRLSIINELVASDGIFLKNIALDDDTIIKMYKYLQADIVTIGQNYAIEERVKFDAEKAGAKLIKIDTDQRYSTSSIINKIIGKYVYDTQSP